MKKILLIAILVPFALNCLAQYRSSDNHLLGARGAYRMYDMVFSYEGYDEYEHSWLNSYSYGIYSRHRLSNNLFLRADLMFNKRGIKAEWSDVEYQIEANYYDIRLPFLYVFGGEEWSVLPYLYAGPSLDFAYSGNISYSSSLTPNETESLNQDNFKSFDLGVVAGIGFDIPVNLGSKRCNLSIEAGIDFGMINTFSDNELKGNIDVVNPEISNERNYGTRKNRGYETSVSFSIPLGSSSNNMNRSRINPRGRSFDPFMND